MLQILCWIDTEDYLYLQSMNEQNQTLNYYGYTFEVEGGAEGIGTSVIRLLVVEFVSAKMAVGFVLPNNFVIEGKELTLRIVSPENPSKDIPVVCKISDEIKKGELHGRRPGKDRVYRLHTGKILREQQREILPSRPPAPNRAEGASGIDRIPGADVYEIKNSITIGERRQGSGRVANKITAPRPA